MAEHLIDRTQARRVRVLIVADTHGALDEGILARAQRCDEVVHAGDIGSREVLEALTPIIAVRGNNDVPAKWPGGDHPLLEALPWCGALELPGGRLVVEHGHELPAPRRHALLRARHPRARAIVYGHSHRLVRDTRTRPWVLNPGAAGRVRTFGGASCMVLTASEDRWRLTVARFPR